MKGNHETSLESVQIAISCGNPDVFLLAGHFGFFKLIGGMMGDTIEGEDVGSVHTCIEETGRSDRWTSGTHNVEDGRAGGMFSCPLSSVALPGSSFQYF